MLSVVASSRLVVRRACYTRAAFLSSHSPFYSTTATFDNSTMLTTIDANYESPVSWMESFQSTWNNLVLENSIWNMSSTLKKRRAKMNKHKLRKRRKKLRLKSKK
jgi:hypothetical protein